MLLPIMAYEGMLPPNFLALLRPGNLRSKRLDITVLSIFSSVISVMLILMCGTAVSSSPTVSGFSSFLRYSVKEDRSFTVLRYHLFALSCLIQVNTIFS